MEYHERETVYGREEYDWGRDPSRLARLVDEYLPTEWEGLRLLDLGAGAGRDAGYFARQDMEVSALDISPAGLATAE